MPDFGLLPLRGREDSLSHERFSAAQDMLLVHFYAGTAATPVAERYASCMIEATGLGGKGGGNLGMPMTITFRGTRTTGTASKDASTGEVTFTPGT